MAEEETVLVANAVLTFVDETGREYLAGACIGPLLLEGDPANPQFNLEELIDRAFTITRFSIVLEDSSG